MLIDQLHDRQRKSTCSVSLMIPDDTVPAMKILADPKIRREVGVSETNYFVFASSQLSELNFSGWHAVKETCREVTLLKPNLINATNNQHCVSTIYIYI